MSNPRASPGRPEGPDRGGAFCDQFLSNQPQPRVGTCGKSCPQLVTDLRRQPLLPIQWRPGITNQLAAGIDSDAR